MEQTPVISNPGVRFTFGALGIWLALTMCASFIFLAMFWSANHKAPVPKPATTIPTVSATQQFQNEFSVAGAAIHSNSGEALVKLEGFNIPVKFDFATDPEIEITNLEIGAITTVYDKPFNDFTTREDHKAINAALVAYIKNNGANQ